MNKLLTKIVGAVLGASMAVGVGVAVASNKSSVPVHATETETITLQESTFSGMGNNNYGSGVEYTGTVTSTSSSTSISVGGHYITKNSGWQWQANNANVYNITALPGRITSVVLNQTGTARAFDCYGGTEQLFSSSETGTGKTPSGTSLGNVSAAAKMTWTAGAATNYTYFAIHHGSNAAKVTSIIVTFELAASATYTVSFNNNGGSGSMSPVADVSGSYSLPACTFTAPQGKVFAGWKAEDAGSIIAVGGSYTVSGDVEFYAQWADAYTVTYSAGTNGSGSYAHTLQPAGSYTLLPFTSLTGVSALTGYRFKNYTVGGADKNPGDSITLSAATAVTVNFEEEPAEVVINKDNIASFASSYAERDWTYGSGSSAISGKTYSYKNNDYIQLQKTSKSTCYFYNLDAIPGPITKIEMTVVNNSATTAMLGYFAKSSAITSKPASGEDSKTASSSKWTWTLNEVNDYHYFYICNGADDTKYIGQVTITYKKIATVDPTSITLDNSTAIIMDTYGYGKRNLKATVGPVNANDKTVTWVTSNSSVVTVSNGVLTPVGTGDATVYATTSNFVSDVATPELKASVSVTVNQALYMKATFTPTSTSAATQSDDYLAGGSVALTATTAGSYNNEKQALQLGGGKDVTFTVSGYAGMKITGIDMVISSNGNAGSGSLTVTAGTTNVLTIATAPFEDATWNGAYDANPCQLYKAITDYVVGTGETIKFAFAASVNSLYIHSVSFRYLDYSLEAWCQKFLDTFTCSGVTQAHPDGAITAEDPLDPDKTPADIWDELGLEFLDLDPDLIDIAAKANADKDSDDVIEQAMARYDLVIRKYGTTTYSDYIERFGVGKVNGPLNTTQTLFDLTGTSSVATIIIVVSVLSLTTLGGYFLLRKRKEQ